jgi:hypothetical protein
MKTASALLKPTVSKSFPATSVVNLKGDDCTKKIECVYRYRHIITEPWREWPLCELHKQIVDVSKSVSFASLPQARIHWTLHVAKVSCISARKTGPLPTAGADSSP